MDSTGGVAVCRPYAERAAVALAAEMRSSGPPVREFVPSVGPLGASASGSGIFSVNSWGELLRRGLNKARNAEGALWGLHLSKILYSRAAAQLVARSHPDVILGFPGACLEIFQSIDAFKVFHAVDAHPRAHNKALATSYGPHARAEQYPTWLVSRIETELASANLVLVPSNLVADQMIRNGVPCERIAVVPYGVDLDLFKPDYEHIPDRDVDTPVALYVGMLSRRKGLPTLLTAAALSDIQISLLGQPFDRRLTRTLPPNVSLQPTTDHEGLAKAYRLADVFILPTVEDACSLVVLEAAASGLPILTTPMNGAIEILPRDVVTLLPVDDSLAWAAALQVAVRLNHQQRLKNAACVRRAGTVRSWRDYALAVIELLTTRTALA